jgi:PAS domain S-box-containing protein
VTPTGALDDLTALAADLCSTPVSMIWLVDGTRPRVVSCRGVELDVAAADFSCCAGGSSEPDVFEVPDALADPHVADDPLVTKGGFRFYAGAPLRDRAGHAVGTICVVDRVPRQLTAGQREALRALGRQVTTQLELHRQAGRLAESERRLRAIFDTEPECVKLLAADGSLLEMNAAGLRIIEADSFDQVAGQRLEALIAGHHRESFNRLLSDVFAGRSSTATFQLTGLKGTICWLESHAAPLRDASGAIVAALGITRDISDRVRAEEEIRFQRSALEMAHDAANLGVWHHDLPTGRLTLDERAMRHLGVTESPSSFDAVLAGVHPEDRGRLEQELRGVLGPEGTGRCAIEFRVRHPDGRLHWLSVHVRVLFQDEGDVRRAVRGFGTSQDVTERRRAEQRVVKLNRVYAVLSGINEILARDKEPDRILSSACRIAVAAGRFPMAWIGMVAQPGKRLEVRAHAGADEGTLAVIERLIHEDPPAGCAFTAAAFQQGHYAICNDIANDPQAVGWRDAALSRGYCSMGSFPLKQLDRVVGTFNIYASEAHAFDRDEVALLDQLAPDISFALEMHARDLEHQRADAERRRVEERFREVVETIQEVFWITSPGFDEMFYVSPAYETIWGRSCDNLYASPYDWLEAIHPEDRERIRQAIRSLPPHGQLNETYRIHRPDGSVRWIRDRAFPVSDASGTVVRIVGTATDITEQRQLEEQFRQAQKMESVGRLAGGIAHDFNNLLTVINGTADLAITTLPPDDPLRTDLEQIIEAGDRAAALTRQLLALSRRQILRPEVIDLSTVIDRMRAMLRRLIGEDIVLAFALSGDLGRVRADPGQIEQVVMNLAVNARDAMPDGGTLTIETRNEDFEIGGDESGVIQPGPHVMVAVGDTGHGMDERTRQRIFEPFFTTKELGKGTGLGLSTVYGIVQQSGGTVWVDSEPGRGSTFKIYLPRVDDISTGDGSPLATALARGTETILLVEDETALRALTTRVLTSAGYTVLDAADGAEALRVLEQYAGPVHLTLTDVVMPGMSGRELAERLQQLRPETKVLYMSGYTDDAILRHGVLDDPAHFIGKPYTPADLRRRVREALDRR